MTGIDIFALIILITIACTGVGVFVYLAMWPGKVAKQRGHAQAEAIQVGSWVTLIAGGIFWPLVVIWAYYQAPETSQGSDVQEGEL